ncbi:hypothetical protein LTR10_019347 [Elasticomyces elasticus]|uniref:Stress-response A/B barrel domain-containing protein n=1 Tax=Exophiala sideris TaxID=1016849 RepID=A0ABR0J125_9EURO|nr:hypothetical protein LTR10_019347 [Elasticomyces elasticus]KAK5024348.1 hypothetical protein LTS07_008639 [Exophiala sideris]KAK5030970.1 hypothetical protein LTR13_007983 [Exophiala sideris]KAK5054081.1 hypothetical protein LTR69_009043 [Exophiala sideris]KAK5179563.1 hypothetical protein LTR44_008079 [Eurotiomycetes sp. CCFEE 6388]
MPVYHIVLMKFKPHVGDAEIEKLKAGAANMVGKIPGLQSVELNKPHPSTAHRSQGFDFGLVAVFDKAETIKVFADHPVHLQ